MVKIINDGVNKSVLMKTGHKDGQAVDEAP